MDEQVAAFSWAGGKEHHARGFVSGNTRDDRAATLAARFARVLRPAFRRPLVLFNVFMPAAPAASHSCPTISAVQTTYTSPSCACLGLILAIPPYRSCCLQQPPLF